MAARAESNLADDSASLTEGASPCLSRRDFLKVAGLAAAGTALASCAPFLPGPAPTPGRKVQLVYQDWNTDWFAPMAQRMLDQYHATHPSISVFYPREPDDVETRMLRDMEAGTAPDVFEGCCSWFPILAQKGYSLDLGPYVRADLDRATIEDW